MSLVALMVLLLLLIKSSEEYSFFKRNQMKIEKLENCEEVDRMVGRYDGIASQDRFKTNLRLDGNLTIKKDVYGPIEIHYSLTRCDLDRSNCEDYDKFIFKNICERIRDRTSVFTQVDHITPKFSCPIKSGIYSLNNATVNLDIFSRFPISGYRWLIFIKYMVGKNKKQAVFCIDSDIIITSPKGKTLNNIFKVHSTSVYN